MHHAALRVLAVVLVLCVLSVGGLAQAESVEHAGHHAHHQAATHGTVLCSWMCAAGTVLESPVILLQADRSPIATVAVSRSLDLSIEPCHTAPSRAPPSVSL